MKRRLPAFLLLVAALCAISACTTVRVVAREVSARVSHATKPVKYSLAGAAPTQRESLNCGVAQLKAGEHRAALGSLRRALWDLERIEKRWLRIEELAETYRAMADAYDGLRKVDWADEHRTLAAALIAHQPPDDKIPTPERELARGKAAYRAAKFREAASTLGRALVELEDVARAPARIASLEDARCHLVLSHFALDQEERAREEIRRLGALDEESLATCRRSAPPAVRALMRDVQTSEARRRAP